MLKRFFDKKTPMGRTVLCGIVLFITLVWAFYAEVNGTRDLKTASSFSHAVALIAFWFALLDWLVFDGKIVGKKPGDKEGDK